MMISQCEFSRIEQKTSGAKERAKNFWSDILKLAGWMEWNSWLWIEIWRAHH